MSDFKIGDDVLFVKIKGGHLCGYERDSYKIAKMINEEDQPMYYIRNKLNEFWTNEKAITKDEIIYEQMTLF